MMSTRGRVDPAPKLPKVVEALPAAHRVGPYSPRPNPTAPSLSPRAALEVADARRGAHRARQLADLLTDFAG